MIVKKKEFTEQEIKEIRATLDVIDISLYDLLVKRKELRKTLENWKQNSVFDLSKELSESIQKITEQRKYNKEILSATAGIINASNFNEKKLTIGIQTKKDEPKILENLQKIYPSLSCINYQTYSKQKDIIDALATYPNMIASISIGKTSPKDVWWMSLLPEDKKNYKIISKIPFIDEGEDEEYFITKTHKYFNFDRSVFVLATSEAVNPNWLKTALHKINIPLYRIIDSTAIFNGTVLYLVEVSYKVKSGTDEILKLNETVNNVNIRMAGYLGGYFLPIIEKDKIISFHA